MISAEELLEIAKYLNLPTVEKELEDIIFRSHQENASIILPLVGEFSSGKTSLINSLTDSKKLETATKPTTATIYEVHFGCEKCKATVLDENNQFVEFDDISDLKNDALVNAKVVTVFDTSSKVPSTTVLVDTPGLSSPDPKHKQTLVNFLPKADGILLVSDINQQITRSLSDFIDTMKLSKKPIYLVLTKSDTKSEADIDSAKKYISENCQVPIKQIAIVSAMKGNLDEIYALLDSIQANKKDIIMTVDEQRIKNIAQNLLNHVDELMKASSSNAKMEEAIRVQELELNKINRKINNIIESVSDDIADINRTISRKFEDIIFGKLNSLVSGTSSNFNAEAVSMINSTSSLLLSEYKDSVKDLLREKVRNSNESSTIDLSSLMDMDMSSLQISGLSYNLDLDSMGHQYDKLIKTGVIAVAAIGAVAVAAAAAPAAAAAEAGAAEAGVAGISQAGLSAAAFGVDEMVDIADTVTDVQSIVSNNKTANRIERASGFISNAKAQYETISADNIQYGQEVGSDKGLIDSIVGFATDKLMSKPQRVHAVRNYIDSTLAPEFKESIDVVSRNVVSSVKEMLQTSAAQVIEQKTSALNTLMSEYNNQRDVFEQRMTELESIKSKLS